MDPELISRIESHLDHRIEAITRVRGGDMHEAYRLQTGAEIIFCKVNARGDGRDYLEAEVHGLEVIDGTNTIRTPRVIENIDNIALLIEFIDNYPPTAEFYEAFGRSLATLHRSTQNAFGLDRDNYIGILTQSNPNYDNWTEFYAAQRIWPQAQMAREKGLLTHALIYKIDKFIEKINRYFPEEPPALIHGDLWGGNYLCSASNEPVLIDPAVYYGHRYMDLGMITLFGHCPQIFFEAYNEVYQLPSDYTHSLRAAQVYYLLVHVNLFGTSYLNQLDSALNQCL